MIRRLPSFFFILLAVVWIPFTTMADSIADADALYEQGGMKNLFQAIDGYKNFLERNPEHFDGFWKCARAHREYGETAKKDQIEGWKKVCAKYGKKGMIYAAKAREINPDHPAGHYYYGLNVGIYADGTSILTALKEGLKNKTQRSFEKSYELDKMYAAAGSILALGRFWAVLPWPMANSKKSLAYYREYQQTPYFQEGAEGRVYLAELLVSMGGKAYQAEARQVLEPALQAPDPYFRNRARRLLDRIR